MNLKSLKHLVLSFLALICWVAIVLCITGYVFLTTTWGAKLASTYFIETYIPFCNVSIGSYQGTIEKGVVLKDVTISHIPDIKDAVIHIQDLRIRVPLTRLDQVSLDVVNAKISLAGSDPLVFTGAIVQQNIKGNCYAQNLDARQVVDALGYSELAKNIYGFISHVDFEVTGTIEAPRLKGHFVIDKFTFKNTQVSDGFSHLDLTFLSLGDKPALRGFIITESALVKVEKINIDLMTSKVDFNGDVRDFALDIHGSSKIEDIMIDMAIKGTFLRPKLLFNSDPPMSEENILITLATGKSWSGIDAQQGVGLRKKLTDTLNVGMEVQEQQTRLGRDQALGYSRTLEGQMKLSDKFSLNVSKKYLPSNAEASSSNVGTSQPQKDNESEIYLQYKQRF